MLRSEGRSLEIGKWLALLVAGLVYFIWTANVSWIIVLVLSISTLSLVAAFIYFHHEQEIKTFIDTWRRELPTERRFREEQTFENYTMRDLRKFQNESSVISKENECFRANQKDFAIDNRTLMHKYHEYTEPVVALPKPISNLRKTISFDDAEEEQEKVHIAETMKKVRFDVGALLSENNQQFQETDLLLHTNPQYRIKRLEEAAEKIVTGLMTQEELSARFQIEYHEPKPVQQKPAISPQPATTQPGISQTAAGIFGQKETTVKEKVGPLGVIPPSAKKDNPILIGLKPQQQAQVDITNPPASQLSKPQTFTDKSKPSDQMTANSGGILGSSSRPGPSRMGMEFEAMESENVGGVNRNTQGGPVLSFGSPGNIFGSSSSAEQIPGRNQLAQAPDSRASQTQQRGPRGATPEHSIRTTEIKGNLLFYQELAKKANSSIKEQKVVTKEKMAVIKDIIQDFFSKLCSNVDDYFLNSCQRIIDELDHRRGCEEEYLAFVFEFVTKFILDYVKLMSNNKIKIIYSGVFFQIISIYHCSLIELLEAIAFRKFEWLRGNKLPILDDRLEYLGTIGFPAIKERIKKTDFKTEKEYFARIAAKLARREEGEALFTEFYNRLDFYSLVLFNALSCDLRVQLRECNSDLANKYLADWKPSHEYLYFQIPGLVLKAAPSKFWPLILRNWVSVGSDIWETAGDKLLKVVKYFHDVLLPKLEKEVLADNADYDIFNHKTIIQEFKASAIAFREDILEIVKEKRLKSKDLIFDPNR